MRIQFDLPFDAAARLTRHYNRLIQLPGRKFTSPSDLARSLLLEVLYDDAAVHGELDESDASH